MPLRSGTEGVDLLLRIFDKPVTTDARRALATCVLRAGELPGCQLAVESHGQVSSIAVLNSEDWLLSFCTAKEWVLAYARPPLVRRGAVTLGALQAQLPHAQDRGDDHYTVRLHDYREAKAFCDIVLEDI